MRNITKVTSVILAFLLLIPFCVNVSADATANDDYEKLVAFGIMNVDDALSDGEAISRSYFTKYAIKLTGLTDSMIATQEYQNPFVDIGEDENINYIKAAHNLGLISGTAPGYFEPQKSITVAQAVKILVCALGYGGYAAYEGGYPSGYLIIADRIELLKGVSVNTSETLTWNTFVKLLYNAFHVDVLQGVGIVENGASIEAVMSSKEGENALALFYDIYGFEGIMDSNEFTSLTGKSEVPYGCVSVGDRTLKIGKTEAYDLIGYYVEGYYKLDEIGNKTLLYIAEDEDRNTVYNVAGKDVENATSSQFAYFKEGAKASEKLSLSNVAVLIYNGAQVEMDAALMKPANGFVTLIDNNHDGIIDVISVMNYSTVFVNGISADTFTVNSKDGTSIELDPFKDDYHTVIKMDEDVLPFNEIKVNYVISYAAYPSSQRYIKYVQVSNKSVVGTVEQIDQSGYATINGAEYKYASGAGVELGMSGTFYLDFMGTIIEADATKDFVYGYLNSLHKGTGLNAEVTVQIFSENGNWIETTLDDRIKLDGESGKTPAQFYSSHSGDYRQLIRYNVNADGEVIEIDFPVTETEDTDEDEFRLSKTHASDNFRKASFSFGGIVNLWPGTTKIFSIPADDLRYDKDRFNIFDYSELINGGVYTNIEAYDVDEVGIASAIVIDENNQIITNSGIYIAEEVVTILNEKGDAVPGIKAYFDGANSLTLCVRDEAVIAAAGGVSRGDIIQCTINAENEIIAITKRYDYSEEYGTKFLRDKVYATATFTAGTVKTIDYERLRFKLDNGTDATFSLEGTTYVWIYDIDTDKVSVASLSQLQKDDYIFSRINTLFAREIIIFR